MKKFFGIIIAMAMIFSLSVSQIALAAENYPSVTTNVTSEATNVEPRGSLSGSNSVDVSAGTTSGSFNVDVKGIPWATAESTFSISGFNSDTFVRVYLYYPGGGLAWDTLSYAGTDLSGTQSMSKTIAPGSTGTYRVEYKIYTINGSTPSGGKISCTIK